MADYYTLLTNDGLAYETARKVAGLPIKLTKMSVGDGNGAVYNPDATATALRREVWRGDINALLQDPNNSNWLIAELTIPDSVGGWYVREAGIWTDTGVLYAIVKYPESFKPVMAASGSGKEFYLRAIFQTSNATSVTLQVDETVVKATRAWVVDFVSSELAKRDAKQSVRVATVGPITLSGSQTIDGVAVVAGDRVLVKDQASASANGIYVAAVNAWSRSSDADNSSEVTPQMLVFVEEGVALADTLWQLTTNAPIVLNTTQLNFEQLAGRNGVTPGNYRQVIVDSRGLVVGGSNPSTLGGYGISDAYTSSAIDTLLKDKVQVDSITVAGFAGNDEKKPYFRKRDDDRVIYLQPELGYAPVRQGVGPGQLGNAISIGWDGAQVLFSVDGNASGNLWGSGNFDPSKKADWGSKLSDYKITDAYTKSEADNLLSVKANSADVYSKANVDGFLKDKVQVDSITVAGFAGNDEKRPYFRKKDDNQVVLLQPALGFVPVRQGVGPGQLGNAISIGWDGAQVLFSVDGNASGNLWGSGNFDPSKKADWGSKLSDYKITDAYTKSEADNLLSVKANSADVYSKANVDGFLKDKVQVDSITVAGFSGNNADQPYFRKKDDNQVILLQPALGFVPVQQGGGPGQYNNKIRMGWSGSGIRISVDGADLGDCVNDANLSSKIVGLGLHGVGQYAFARLVSAAVFNQGEVVEGSRLLYSSTENSDGTVNNSGLIGFGTWRCHGAVSATNRTLWQRIA